MQNPVGENMSTFTITGKLHLVNSNKIKPAIGKFGIGIGNMTNLRSLTLNGCGLSTLEGFPTLPDLRRLELSDNNLSEGLDGLQDAALFQLKSLSLAGNKFATLDDLDPLVRAASARLKPPQWCPWLRRG